MHKTFKCKQFELLCVCVCVHGKFRRIQNTKVNLVECSNILFIYLNPLTLNIILHLTISQHFNITFLYVCAVYSMVTREKKRID